MHGEGRSILLLGAGGQVGGELLTLLGSEHVIVAPRSSELDLADEPAIRRMVRDLQPRWIVNAAAYTAVDRAESEVALAHAINADAVRILGEEARACNAALIHFSTDYVFDGKASSPRRESDPTGPLGVYGSSKLAGEQGLAASGAAHFIFRTSWVYSTSGKNFLLTILKLARERDELRIVADQLGAPTFARDLAKLTQHTMRRIEEISSIRNVAVADAASEIGGLYHACNSGETSWFRFAEEFIALARTAEPHQRFAALKPIATAEYPTLAKRPADSRLDCTRLRQQLGYEMPTWQRSLALAMEELSARQAVSRS